MFVHRASRVAHRASHVGIGNGIGIGNEGWWFVECVRLAWRGESFVEGSEGGPRPTLRRIQAHHTLDRRSP